MPTKLQAHFSSSDGRRSYWNLTKLIDIEKKCSLQKRETFWKRLTRHLLVTETYLILTVQVKWIAGTQANEETKLIRYKIVKH